MQTNLGPAPVDSAISIHRQGRVLITLSHHRQAANGSITGGMRIHRRDTTRSLPANCERFALAPTLRV